MKLLTDSACDLTMDYMGANNINFFSLHVELDGKSYTDIVDIKPRDIYQAISNGGQPKTSQVSPEAFLTKFEEIAKSGEEAVYIALSSELSGTYSTALMIRNQVLETYPESKIHVIDTKCAAFGQGLVVKEAVRLRDAGVSMEELIEKIQHYSENMEHIFTVDDLNHLARGGRLSKTGALVGGLLNIKPILSLDQGKILPIDKVRGRKRLIKQVVDLMEERGGDFSNKIVGISHCDDEEMLAELQKAISERLSPKGFDTALIGAVIGSHVGLGAMAVFFTNKNYNG